MPAKLYVPDQGAIERVQQRLKLRVRGDESWGNEEMLRSQREWVSELEALLESWESGQR